MFDKGPGPPSTDSLNPEQRAAVLHGSGPALVIAGAGTGKTWTLACRVAHLVTGGVPPQRLLLLTFTRRAAREMLSRAERLTGAATGRVWGGTFHAVANRLLRAFGRPLGLAPDFTVLDRADGADLMDLVRGELGLGSGERRFPGKDTLASIYSRTVNEGLPLAEVLERRFPWCAEHLEGIRRIFTTYTERKRRQGFLDYDDLLLYWNALQRSTAGLRVTEHFDHVLVDEYQDTNALQADILEGLRIPNTMVVGDDAQAIYSFRAATVRNILEFPQRFRGAALYRLERNYRSTQPLLDASNDAIALAARRHEKTLRAERRGERRPELVTALDEAGQSDEVCRLLLDHREQGTPLRRQAVLFRAGHHSGLLEVELTRRNIPFVKFGGLKFLEAAHVKDALALLRILENPYEEVSWFRVLQMVEGVGPATARKLCEVLGVRRGPGGEWDVVHVLHAADGMIPSDMATGNEDEIEEERRLFYVALTRARDALYVHVPLRYYRRPRGLEDPHAYAQVTRFLPPSVRARFDERSTAVGDPSEDQVGPGDRPLGSVDRFLADLWGSPHAAGEASAPEFTEATPRPRFGIA